MWPFNGLSLFWKIFLWFWGAMVLMVSVSVLVWQLHRDGINFHPASGEMNAVINKLAYILESDLPPHRKRTAINRLLSAFAPPPPKPEQRPRPQSFQPFYLITTEGELRSGQQPPQAVLALLNRSSGQVQAATQGSFLYWGPKPVRVKDVHYQLIVTQYMGPFRGKMIWHLLHGIFIWQLIAFVLVSGVFCVLLAYAMTRPIKLLQQASQRVARGERVSAVQLLNRRSDEFYLLAKDFDAMADKILSTVTAQKHLLSDVSHELRSPLARMQIALGLLEKQAVDEQQVYIQRLEKDCQRMDEMVGQLLNLAALERGRIYEELQPINISELIGEVVRDAQFEAAEKKVVLESRLNPNVTVNGYYGLLYSAVENVVRNAIRYSPVESCITLVLNEEGGYAMITVSDQGAGVADDQLSTIFEPFYRTDQARSRAEGGAGLGLAITARAVRAHQGSITAKNLHGSGLCVEIRLPLPAADKNSSHAASFPIA